MIEGLFARDYETPFGELRLVCNERALIAARWAVQGSAAAPSSLEGPDHPLLVEVVRQLDAYFQGELQRFDIQLELAGTDFQRAAWMALVQIPYGETRSYLDQARAMGAPAAVRAVGAANGQNPVAIIVPCHRVVGASGALTGYAGGLDAKRRLLALEQGAPRQGRLFA